MDELKIKALCEEGSEEQKEECTEAEPNGGTGFLSKTASKAGTDGSYPGNRQNHVREGNVVSLCNGRLFKTENQKKHTECRKHGAEYNR
jgi:hypothetical protein